MCDYPKFYSESTPVARKPYRCEVCNLRIPKGVKHYAISGKWDLDVDTYRMHLDCQNAYSLVAAHYSGDNDCVAFQETMESIAESSRGSKRAALGENLRNARSALAASLREFRRAA